MPQRLMHDFPAVDFATWRAQVDKDLKGADYERRLVTRTADGLTIQPIYSRKDWPSQGDPAGFAGAPPYRRGGPSVGRYDASWDTRQRYDHPQAGVVAQQIRDDLARGASSVWLLLNPAQQAGRDDVTQAPGLVARTVDELGQALAGADLDRVGVQLDPGGNALSAAALLFALARRRGIRWESLHGCLGGDPLGALAARGELPFDLDCARRQLGLLGQRCAAEAPQLRALLASSLPYHEAGASAAQEIGFVLATAATYLRWLTEAGLGIDEAASQIQLGVGIGGDFFVEVAKLRALRQCWAKLIAACGGSSKAQRAVIHASTGLRSKTQRDPWVNMLRGTAECFAGAVGGADALTSLGFDALLGPSDAFARRIAANLQVVLNEEAHVARVADPAGGSAYVECLTDELARRGWRILQGLETEGGMAWALQSGRAADLIDEVAEARAQRVATRKDAITGVSEFAFVEEPKVERTAPDWVALGNSAGSQVDLTALEAALDTDADLFEAALNAAEAGASLGSLTGALSADSLALQARPLLGRRAAEPFERLRDHCDAAALSGSRPRFFSCNLGSIPEHKARAAYAAGFLHAGGLAVSEEDGFQDVEEAVEAFKRSGTSLAVVCGSDDQYSTWLAELAPALRAAGATQILVAGRPGDHEQAQRDAGVTDFIYVGCDVLQTLQRVLSRAGVAS